jgi:hypothetical protein
MNIRAVLLTLLALLAAALLAATPAMAQQIYGTPGSPSATTTVSGKQLPPPAPKFGEVIKEKAWWPPRVVPPTVLGVTRR